MNIRLALASCIVLAVTAGVFLACNGGGGGNDAGGLAHCSLLGSCLESDFPTLMGPECAEAGIEAGACPAGHVGCCNVENIFTLCSYPPISTDAAAQICADIDGSFTPF